MITKWFEMKRKEIECKLAFYSFCAGFFDEKKEMLVFINKLFLSLKDVSVDDLKDRFLTELAALAHESVMKDMGPDTTGKIS